jgi:hypothetical protein
MSKCLPEYSVMTGHVSRHQRCKLRKATVSATTLRHAWNEGMRHKLASYLGITTKSDDDAFREWWQNWRKR